MPFTIRPRPEEPRDRIAARSGRHPPPHPSPRAGEGKPSTSRQVPKKWAALLHRADERQDLLGVGTEILGDLVLQGLGRLDEAGLVDLLDELDADLLEL